MGSFRCFAPVPPSPILLPLSAGILYSNLASSSTKADLALNSVQPGTTIAGHNSRKQQMSFCAENAM